MVGERPGPGEPRLVVPGRAQRRLPAPAPFASAAGPEALGDRPAAEQCRIDARTQGVDHPGPLVTGHHRVADVGRVAMAVVHLAVAHADPGRGDPHPDLTGTGFGNGPAGQPVLAGPLDGDRP